MPKSGSYEPDRDQIVDDRELTRARSEDRGVLSPLLIAGLALAMAFLVWFPIGRSEFTPVMWLWVLVLAGVVAAQPPHPQGQQERHRRASHVQRLFRGIPDRVPLRPGRTRPSPTSGSMWSSRCV